MKPHPPLETEVKLRIPSVQEWPGRLQAHGFCNIAPRQRETSVLWDQGQQLLAQGSALRVRSYDGRTLLTWKGPKQEDPLLKIRPELETEVSDLQAMEGILEALGFSPVLTMNKTRAVWRSSRLIACLDETPFGDFLELEGDADDIEAAMQALELDPAQAETRSYPTLFREHDRT